MSELTQAKLKELLSYDPDTGLFTWRLSTTNRVHVGDMAGSKTNYGYIQIVISEKNYKAHRLAWLYMYGEWPEYHIDHINGVRTDNRIENLRDVTRFINLQNQKKATVNSKTELLGASPNKCGKYRSQITIDRKTKYLGLFDTAEMAHNAYLEAKRKFHPGCTI